MNDNKNNTPKRLYRSAVDRKICGVCGGCSVFQHRLDAGAPGACGAGHLRRDLGHLAVYPGGHRHAG